MQRQRRTMRRESQHYQALVESFFNGEHVEETNNEKQLLTLTLSPPYLLPYGTTPRAYRGRSKIPEKQQKMFGFSRGITNLAYPAAFAALSRSFLFVALSEIPTRWWGIGQYFSWASGLEEYAPQAGTSY